MSFEDKEGIYRRFTRQLHVIIIVLSLACLPYFLAGYAEPTLSSKSIQIISGKGVLETFVFLSSFAMNFGMTVWVTFIAGLVMYKNLPVHTFGQIQSKLFPFFFFVGSLTGLAMLFVTLSQAGRLEKLSLDQKSMIIATATLTLCFILNGLWLGPTNTAIVMEKHRMEKEEGDKSKLEKNEEYKSIQKKFGRIHGVVTILNLIVMLCNVFILYWLSMELHNLATITK